jgi:hypothetical protein
MILLLMIFSARINMPRIKFKRTVLRAAAYLEQRGYRLSAPQSGTDVVQFFKDLMPGVRCYIEFDLKSFPSLDTREFDVILWRVSDFQRDALQYQRLNISLSNLVKYVYGREEVSANPYWEFNDEKSLYDQVTHTQRLLIEYGIGWLEDPLSLDPWRIPAEERDAFRNILTTVVAEELGSMGYVTKYVADIDFPVFVKPLDNGLKAVIEIIQTRRLNPSRFEISVKLHRKLTENPYKDLVPNCEGWLSSRLEVLLEDRFDKDASAGREETWQYSEHEELRRRMQNMLAKIKNYAIPWLEDPTSQNP